MAVYLPIISEFNSKGIDRARREFQSLEGFGAKTAYALKKAFIPATAAIAGLAAVAGNAVDAALEDAQAASELARTLKAVTGATDPAIRATEDWITQQGKLFGITDTQLRPALGKMVRVTKDVSKAQKLLGLAFDISAGTGKDLGSVTDALSKAYAGNMKSLKALAPELTPLIKDGAKVNEVFAKLADNFGGAAQKNAETTAGRLAILKLRFSEMFEQIGYALLPAFEKLMPYFERLATWLENNPDKVAAIAAKFGDFAKAVIDAGLTIGTWASNLKNVFIDVYNFIAEKINDLIGLADKLLGPLINFGEIGKLEKGPKPPSKAFKETTKGILGSVGPGFYLPPDVAGPVIGRERVNNITINVSGGDPQSVVDRLKRWAIQNGPLPVGIRTQ